VGGAFHWCFAPLFQWQLLPVAPAAAEATALLLLEESALAQMLVRETLGPPHET
jgi:hypothetical protein